MSIEDFRGFHPTVVNPDLPHQDQPPDSSLESGSEAPFFDLLNSLTTDQKDEFFRVLNLRGFGREDLDFIKNPEKAERIMDSFMTYLGETDAPRKRAAADSLAKTITDAIE